MAASNTFTQADIDANAAGSGWFVDRTAMQNEEFAAGGNSSELRGLGDASSRVDLLTVIAHELGHVFGLHYDSTTDVMHADLPVGVQRPLQPELIDAAFSPDWHNYLLQ